MLTSRITRLLGTSLAAATLFQVLPPPATAQETAHAAAVRSLAICRRIAELPPRERGRHLDAALALAEHAIDEQPDDPVAYFAAFCNRGRRLELEGVGLHVFADVHRLRAHIERTLELAPDWPDAIAGKGALLVSLPAALGGDRVEGQRLLRRALALDATNPETRRLLEQSGADGIEQASTR